jgi:hypothetical protein
VHVCMYMYVCMCNESTRSDKNRIVPKISENVGVPSSDAPEAKSVLDKVFSQ